MNVSFRCGLDLRKYGLNGRSGSFAVIDPLKQFSIELSTIGLLQLVLR
jgi:hypothetical protein